MTKRFYISSIAASMIIMLTAAGAGSVSAQGNDDKPWHVIVYNSDTVEIASFNVEVLADMTFSSG